VEKISQLSTDCLIEQLRDTFNIWKAVLEEIKSLVGFVPKFIAIQPLATSPFEEVSEEYLMKQIVGIQETVDASRKALEAQDVVLFSDTLELKIVPWLKEHERLSQKLIDVLPKS
jgi:hypothetical protein